MELMAEIPNSSGFIGLEDFEHWPSDRDAVGFLAMTTSATSLGQLLSVSRPYLLDNALLTFTAATLRL